MVPRACVMLLVLFGACAAHKLFIHNKCGYNVWVGILGSTIPDRGGYLIRPHHSHTTTVPNHWSGRIWGRKNCRTNGLCVTGDCGSKIHCEGNGGLPPHTLAEITFDTGNTSTKDFYDISLLNGYNIQMSMQPHSGTSGGSGGIYDCTRAGCDQDLNQSCPPEFQVRWRADAVVGCQNACLAYDRDEYCCRGNYSTPETCPPYDYSITFKKACAAAYSYAFDDQKSSFTCNGNSTGSSNYDINFCA